MSTRGVVKTIDYPNVTRFFVVRSKLSSAIVESEKVD
jgi:hypothetical protein